MSTVFFVDNIHALWVTEVALSPEGVITGFVENGQWHVTIDTAAKTIGQTGDRRNKMSYLEIEAVINESNSFDYNEVIEWARSRRRNGKVD